jgi:biopolymer transport protein ExbD
MAGVTGDDDDDGITQINVVPLVDIMLVLLVIFMVTTEFVNQELKNRIPMSVDIQLPKAASSQDTNPALLSLVLNSEGEIFLNGKPSSTQAVKDYVLMLQSQGKKLEAVLAADERLTHGQVVEVIDALRVLGVGDVAINTKRQEIE